MSRLNRAARRRRAPRALTLVEMVICTVLLAVMLVAALTTVGASRMGQRKVMDRSMGHELAQDLLTEILAHPYADETQIESLETEILVNGNPVTVALGPESGEDTGTRGAFDDIDDYHGWTASPPQARDGTQRTEFTGWTRSVTLGYGKHDLPTEPKVDDEGAKVITVTVAHDGRTVAEVMAVQTLGPLATEACCLDDSTCIEMTPTVCSSVGGTAQGSSTRCLTTECASGPRLLFVSGGAEIAGPGGTMIAPTAPEALRIALIESWGYGVDLILDDATAVDFVAAVANVDVAYVSGDVSAVVLGKKLKEAPIGVVSEEGDSASALGLGDGPDTNEFTSIFVVDNGHPITTGFSTTALPIASVNQPLQALTGAMAPGGQELAQVWITGANYDPGLVTLDTGADMYGGGSAAGRRVALPWGGMEFDFTVLNANGQTIMQRSIDWAAADGGDGGGGPTEVLLAAHSQSSDGRVDVNSSNYHAIYFLPSLPVGTTEWSVTRVELQMKKSGNNNGVVAVQLRTADAGLHPTSTVLEEVTINESTLGNSFATYDFTFTSTTGLDPAVGLCIVVKHVSGSSTSASLAWDENADEPNVHWDESVNGGASWTTQPHELWFTVTGMATTP